MSETALQIHALEHTLLRVPLEQATRGFKSTQQLLEDELKAVGEQMAAVVGACAPDWRDQLAVLSARMTALKQKVSHECKQQQAIMQSAKARFDHLQLALDADPASHLLTEWSEQRNDRMLVDYLLREGFHDTATEITQQGGLAELVNVETIDDARTIEQRLLAHDCGPALEWCVVNKARLTKLKSTFEFKLRLQQYVELVRAGAHAEAIAHAAACFPEWSDRHMADIRTAMSLLLFPPSTTCARYQALFDQSRWGDLLQQFRRNNFVLHSLPAQPMLHTVLQAGLASLRTPLCYDCTKRNPNCPVCTPDAAVLAEELPFRHHVNSRVVCPLSGSLLNEHNPPMMLPNGHVYGANALTEMAQQCGGVITCPATSDRFSLNDLQKVFVL